LVGSPLKMVEKQKMNEKEIILERIKSIVYEKHPVPLVLSNLNILYETKFNEKLKIKDTFGSRKLSNVIRDITSLDTRMDKSECYAFVSVEDCRTIHTKEVLIERIKSIVLESHPEPLGLSNFNLLYEKKFEERLNFKDIFPSQSLSDIIKDIPSFDTKMKKSECYAFVRKRELCDIKQKAILLGRISIFVHKSYPDPLRLSNINWLYEKEFNEKLNFRRFYGSLSSLIKDIPSLGTKIERSECVAFVREDESITVHTKTVPQFPRDLSQNQTWTSHDLTICVEQSETSSKLLDSEQHDEVNFSNHNEKKINGENCFIDTRSGFEYDDDSHLLSSNFKDLHAQYIRKGALQNDLLGSDDSSSTSFSLESSSLSECVSQHDTKPLSQYFGHQSHKTIPFESALLCDKSSPKQINEGGLLGHILPHNLKIHSSKHTSSEIYMNSRDPFCLVSVGAQGTGKSHTLSCILENCLIELPQKDSMKCPPPTTALILYFGNSDASICKTVGLVNTDPKLCRYLTPNDSKNVCVPKVKTIILVSPTAYKQRRSAYKEKADFYDVHPILLKWRSLQPRQIMDLMDLNSTMNEIEEMKINNLFRQYQRQDTFPNFTEFLKDVREAFQEVDKDRIEQKISQMQSWVAESQVNEHIQSSDLQAALESGKNFIIVDLTDQILGKEEVNGIFEIMINQFRCLSTKGKKILALDETKKFIDGLKTDKLSRGLIDAAKNLREDDLSIVVNIQNPSSIPLNFFELATVAVFHYFHSPEWWLYLRKAFPLSDEAWEKILLLETGDALVFAPRHNFGSLGIIGLELPMRIRSRMTSFTNFSKTRVIV